MGACVELTPRSLMIRIDLPSSMACTAALHTPSKAASRPLAPSAAGNSAGRTTELKVNCPSLPSVALPGRLFSHSISCWLKMGLENLISLACSGVSSKRSRL